MNIQEIKTIYTAGLEAIVETGADEVEKYNRKNDVSLFMERGNYWVEFSGPVTSCEPNGIVRKNVVDITLTRWLNDDDSEVGVEYFDNPKDAIRFLCKAIRNPKRTMKKMKTWFEE